MTGRFDPVEVRLSCDCVLTRKQWEVEAFFETAARASCPNHGLVRVVAPETDEGFECPVCRARHETEEEREACVVAHDEDAAGV